jgi:hypothetical protein
MRCFCQPGSTETKRANRGAAMSAKSLPGVRVTALRSHRLSALRPRRGEIVEVFRGAHHEHYRVRWDDGRESIHYPSDGTKVRPAGHPAGRA